MSEQELQGEDVRLPWKYQLPDGVAFGPDDERECGWGWSGFTAHSPRDKPCDAPVDLSALLNAAQAHYEGRAATAAEGLAAIRRIRVEAGLGLLEWTLVSPGCWRATAANGAVRYEVTFVDGHWWADEGSSSRLWEQRLTETDAKAACEQWYADWLERAGLEVRR